MGEFNFHSSEYWKMTPSEVGRIVEAKRPKKVGGMHENDFDRLVEHRNEMKAQGIQVY